MTEQFDSIVEQLLQNLLESNYSVLARPPSNIQIMANSDAEKILERNRPGRFDPADGLRTAMRDWETYKTQRIFEKDLKQGYARRKGVRSDVVLKLRGRTFPRALGFIENDTFYVNWIGTHEEANKFLA
jgi:hypothetical protein